MEKYAALIDVEFSFSSLKVISGVFRWGPMSLGNFLSSRGTRRRILVSVVCSIMKLFKFTLTII
jgi:hypothetical protein